MAKTVLIVEDNELNMKLFHDLLEAHGYNTVGTRNGIEALDLARKHRPDLVLMDLRLPDGTGLDACREDGSVRVCDVLARPADSRGRDDECEITRRRVVRRRVRNVL